MQKTLIYFTTASTPIGRFFIGVTEQGLCAINWDKQDWHSFRQKAGKQFHITASENVHNCRPIIDELDSYFNKKLTRFTVPVDLFLATPFQNKVFGALCKIPYGATTTYRDIASLIGKPQAFRAVGTAIGSNPVPIVIPCHRIMRSDGGLGGFGGGLERKTFLLKLENDSFGSNAHIG